VKSFITLGPGPDEDGQWGVSADRLVEEGVVLQEVEARLGDGRRRRVAAAARSRPRVWSSGVSVIKLFVSVICDGL
jgi:hypothetical protein